MPRDISGNYTLPAGNPVVTGTIIDETWANPTMSDFVTQFNNVLTRDGLLGPTAPVKFQSGTAAAPSVTFLAETTLGLYRIGAAQLGVAVSGVLSATFAAASLTAPAFIPTVATIPTNGMYLSAANTLALATNTTYRWSVNSTGNHVFAVPTAGSSTLQIAQFTGAVGVVLTGTSPEYRASDNGANGAIIGVRATNTVNILDFAYGVAIPASLRLNNTEVIGISTARGVTIGPPSSGDTLYIKGSGSILRQETTTARGSGANYHLFADPTGTAGYFGYVADSVLQLQNSLNAAISIATNASVRANFLATGGLDILTPSSGVALKVQGVASNIGQQWTDGTITGHWSTSGGVNAIFGVTSAHNLSLVSNGGSTRVTLNNTGVSIQAPTSSGTSLTVAGFAAVDALTINGGTSGNFRVNATGVPYATSAHNNAGAVTGTTNQYFCSGTYTPTLTNVTNIAASTSAKAQWMRVGNVVTVSGQVQIDATAATAYTQLGISLPIASNLALATDLSGTAACQSGPAIQLVGSVKGDLTNDRAALEYFVGADAGNLPYSYHFTYEII